MNTAMPSACFDGSQTALESLHKNRVVGGVSQGSNDNVTWTSPYTVALAPVAGTLTQTTASSSNKLFQYLRYSAPDAAYGNIAELEFDISP